MKEPANSQPPASLVGRVVRTFELLSVSALSAAEVGRRLDTNRSTALRWLAELEATGYIRRDPKTKRYSTVPSRFLALATNAHIPVDRGKLINQTLARIRDETGDSTIFGVPAERNMTYLGYYATHQVVGLSEGVGTIRPIHCSALGKAYLSALPEDEFETRIARLDYVAGTEKAAHSEAELRKRVATARKDGYAMDLEETFNEVRCVAVPLTIQGQLLGAVCITGPTTRMTVTRIRELGNYLRRELADL
jgi:DNA-binding IclR family transcriptional regulator